MLTFWAVEASTSPTKTAPAFSSCPGARTRGDFCNLCGKRFTHGEARLQQWGNRQTNHHCVHAHCVNGGLGHDHELFPKQATDQDAVDAVTRQRDTITRTAADTEVLLPFAQDPDQASTAAPPDDERDLFGREEALRMDEEIMDFQWFEHVTWDSIKDLRGTTYVQPPTRFRFALQQAQHAILHNNPTSPASESAWKALVLGSWPFLGRPAVNASESNCAHLLDSRLQLFWAEDWSALWAMVRAECDVAPVQNTTRRTEKQQMQSRIRKVATLARTGEKGRALGSRSKCATSSSHRTNCSRDQEPLSCGSRATGASVSSNFSSVLV